MKKFFMLLVAALPRVFASCGDDNDDDDVVPTINLSLTSVSMNYGDTYSDIKCYDAAGKEIKKATWTVADDFIATVDSKTGELTAKHVGETTVKAIYENATATAKVIVKATDNGFTMPLLTFGSSVAQVKAAMDKAPFLGYVEPTAGFDVADALSYSTKTTIYPLYGYGFENDRLVSSSLTCAEGTDADLSLTKFLGQYYKLYDPEKGDEYTTYLCNANNVDQATVLVEMSTLDSGQDYVIWVPAAGTKTRATGAFQASDFEKAREIIRAQVNSLK